MVSSDHRSTHAHDTQENDLETFQPVLLNHEIGVISQLSSFTNQKDHRKQRNTRAFTPACQQLTIKDQQ